MDPLMSQRVERPDALVFRVAGDRVDFAAPHLDILYLYDTKAGWTLLARQDEVREAYEHKRQQDIEDVRREDEHGGTWAP